MKSTTSNPGKSPPGRHDQAVRPTGLVGRVMGLLMARMNDAQNRITVARLPLADGCAVLEIGFGPGKALQQIAGKSGAGRIDGVDHSPLMVETARRRNHKPVAAGRMSLQAGDVAALPCAAGTYEVAFAINSFQQWPDQQAALRNIHRVLKPGGTLCLSIRVPKRDTGIETVEHTRGTVATAAALISATGFNQLREETHDVGKRYAVLVFGTK